MFTFEKRRVCALVCFALAISLSGCTASDATVDAQSVSRSEEAPEQIRSPEENNVGKKE
jgi:Flp pilus assembly protein TadD